jgi:hypothetical protein
MNRKPLNKYNKAELYQLVKDQKDEIKAGRLNADLLRETTDNLRRSDSAKLEEIRDLKEELKGAKTFVRKGLPNMKIGKEKIVRNWRNLFGLLS